MHADQNPGSNSANHTAHPHGKNAVREGGVRRIPIDAAQLIVHPDPEIGDLVPFFLNNRRKELPDLEKFLEHRSFEEIRRMAHTWKGVCRPYGFPFLETLSRELETAAQIEDEEQIHVVVDSIREFLENVRIAP